MQHTAANSLNTQQQTTVLLPCSAPSIRLVSNVNRNIWHQQTAAPFPSHHCDEWMSHRTISRPFFFSICFFFFFLHSDSPEPYRGIFPQMMKQRHSLNSVAGGLQPFLLPEPSQHMAANHAPHRQPCRSRTHWMGGDWHSSTALPTWKNNTSMLMNQESPSRRKGLLLAR